MRKIVLVVASLLSGALLWGVALGHTGGWSKHDGQFHGLKARVAALEVRLDEEAQQNANQNDRFVNLERITSQLGPNGGYNGEIDRNQVILLTNDGCVNGQPRTAWWNNNHLSC